MDAESLSALFSDLPLGAWRFYPSISSTNDAALDWAKRDAPDLSLVLADQQTRGRGRQGRRWHTPPGQALAVSLILRPGQTVADMPHYTALAALALKDALQKYALAAKIKWPNDVLLAGQKIAGILTEAIWEGDQPQAVVIGMGVNVKKGSLPPGAELDFPAASLEAFIQPPPRREALLHAWLEATLSRRRQIGRPAFIHDWQNALVWRGECVQVETSGQVLRGRLIGLNSHGHLLLEEQNGNQQVIHHLNGHLRPCNL